MFKKYFFHLIFVITINFFLFIAFLSLKRTISPSIIFNEGLFILIITSLITFFLVFLANNFQDKIRNSQSVIISFLLILTFHTTVITIVDRSISIFILNEIKNGRGDPDKIKESFINNFVSKGFDKRFDEQLEMKNIERSNSSFTLTKKGESYYNFFNIIKSFFKTDSLIINQSPPLHIE